MICIGLSSTSCLYSAISAIFTNARLSVPPTLRKFTLTIGRVLLCDVVTSSSCTMACDKRTGTAGPKSGAKNFDHDKLTGVKQHSTNSRSSSDASCVDTDADELDTGTVTWPVVVSLFDRLFFLVHMMITSAAVVYFFTDGYGNWADYGGHGNNRTVMEHVCAQATKQGDPNAQSICMMLESI
jgi:hypothetical protein